LGPSDSAGWRDRAPPATVAASATSVWRAVKAVAAALLVHGQLSDAEVRELIEGAAFHDGARQNAANVGM
jgi:hypothetical protein